MASNSEEISLKDLGKKIVKISKSKRKIFTWLLLGIMALSAAYFAKVVLKPRYKSEVILKSKFVRKEALMSILEYYNNSIANDYELIDKAVKNSLINSQIAKLEANEIKPDFTSPDKDDKTKYYKFTMAHFQKPVLKSSEDFNILLNDIKTKIAIDQDIAIGKKRAEEAIVELDSLLKTALPAGNSFKNRMDGGSSMLIMNDLYRSLEELLSKKSGLRTELKYYQTENLIYQISPIVVSKKISFPLIIFVIGLGVWFFVCLTWVGAIIVFSDDE
jgi:hypothetical protein